MPTLGVALITKNAAAHLAECLHSVAFADRVVVLDSGSSDDTLAIAAAHGAQIGSTADWPGFGPQKNRALALLDTDWILALDADEVVTPELAAAIRAAVTADNGPVHTLRRRSSFCGQWIRHSGWYPDDVPRLFKRGSARYSDDLVHERLLFDGTAPMLAGELLHYSYDSYEQVLAKINQYSTAGAQQRMARGKSSGVAKAALRGGWAFFRTYVLKRGFLDGGAGFAIAVMNAETTYYRFLKLGWLQRQG
ncbi:Glycosyltransferase involved in cell wall bisynthesis [Andreprevotia lacus DSM 23236]|jgi:glycosyltransferase involved in cell wall biosynthesis|uniref:Glycosyltransferase involved in cell wall bisynthesis n=1 Tax=Andreprevotia lacus DSM 23236 TaxID=1121001 RepID=A0A1W1XTM8_9NEIS|nr:glycosyltransferase family 2 protein [Andreprevotia lacus]SMC27340.1 Glycosyltransferase involved in cell wall bisynthesis [Andreprevotia lacus DSM 23236]